MRAYWFIQAYWDKTGDLCVYGSLLGERNRSEVSNAGGKATYKRGFQPPFNY